MSAYCTTHAPPLQPCRNTSPHKFSLSAILMIVRSCDVETISGSLKKTRHHLASPLSVQVSLYSLLILLFLLSRLRLTQGILHWEGTWGILYFHDVSFQAQSFSQRWEFRIGGRSTKQRSDSHWFPAPACLYPVFLSLLLCVAWPSIMVSCRFSARLQHFHFPWNPLTPFLFLKTSLGPTASMMCGH